MFVLFRPGKDVWAFGVEPARVRYRLRLARYPAMVEYLSSWLAHAGNDGPYRLLDIGSGFGRTFVYLQAAGLDKRFDLVGIDIDPGRRSRHYANNPWNILEADAEQPLQFDDHSMDVVVCEQLLEHLHHPHRLITEVHRVLKPGGLFICGVPTFPRPVAALRRWLVRRFGLRGSNHVQTYSLHSIRTDLAERFDELTVRGFRIVSGGLLRRLENYEWWYRVNRALGKRLPSLCIEVQLIVAANHKDRHG